MLAALPAAAALLPQLLAPAATLAKPVSAAGDWSSPGLASPEDDATPRWVQKGQVLLHYGSWQALGWWCGAATWCTAAGFGTQSVFPGGRPRSPMLPRLQSRRLVPPSTHACSTHPQSLPCHTSRFFKTESGVKVQILSEGSGPEAAPGDRVLIDYVLRRR